MTIVQSLSRVRIFVTPWTAVCQAPLSLGFSRQEYLSGLPCPPPGDLPNSGIKPSIMSPALAGRFFITSTIWEAPYIVYYKICNHHILFTLFLCDGHIGDLKHPATTNKTVMNFFLCACPTGHMNNLSGIYT